jgi:hypothetical protein
MLSTEMIDQRIHLELSKVKGMVEMMIKVMVQVLNIVDEGVARSCNLLQ